MSHLPVRLLLCLDHSRLLFIPQTTRKSKYLIPYFKTTFSLGSVILTAHFPGEFEWQYKHYFLQRVECRQVSYFKLQSFEKEHVSASYVSQLPPICPQSFSFIMIHIVHFTGFIFLNVKWTFFSDKPITSEYTEKFPPICGTEMQGNLGSIFWQYEW